MSVRTTLFAAVTAIGVVLLVTAVPTFGASYSSPSYKIDASVVGNSFGGQGSSSSYKLVSSSGESIIGNGTGGSYKLGEGYVAQLASNSASTFELTVETATLSLNTVIAGTSQSADFDVTSLTNQTAYELAIHQNQNLTNGPYNVPSVSGDIAVPVSWTESTTKGLGFSLVSAAGLPGKWASGGSYAALPGSATTFYSRTGNTPGVGDVVGMRFRVDVTAAQVSGDYSNTMTITGTTTP